MMRNIKRSPFDAAPQTQEDDWLEDFDVQGVQLIEDAPKLSEYKDLKRSIELQVASMTEKQLEKRLARVLEKKTALDDEIALRAKISANKDEDNDIASLQKEAIALSIEVSVLRKTLRKREEKEHEEIDRLIEEDREQRPVMQDVLESQAKKYEAPKKKMAEPWEIGEARLAAEEAATEEGAPPIRSGLSQEVEIPLPAKKSKPAPERVETLHNPLAVQTARIRPESGWSRFKRGFSNLFGQSSPKIKPEAPVAKPPQEEPVHFEQKILSKGVISARTEPQKEQPGFFARLFKKMEKPVGSEFAKAQKIAGGSKYMRDKVALPPPDAVRLKLEAREAEDRARIAAGKEKIAQYGTEPEIETPPDSAKKDAA